ncbi:MAG: glycosyltransferase [Bacteroidales bacterium]|nr:glycosyltransferase [Bacteroidales bacterium]
MKIIQLIYSLASGGAERFAVSLSNQLAEMGHEVTLCMLLSTTDIKNTFNAQYLKSSVKLYSFEFDRGFSYRKSNIVERFISEKAPDVVHCHLNVIPYIFRLSIRTRSIRFIHTLHSLAENSSGKWWQRWINYCFYRSALIQPVVISEQCRQSYVKFYALDNAVCIENGCEAPQHTPLFPSVQNEVNSYKARKDEKVFIHVARYHELKNQILLIDSFNQLANEGVNFTLLVLGEGFDRGDGSHIRNKACTKIHFLGLKSNVADYLLCSDAFCLTSNYEGLPISLLEAISCGLTPICTNVGGVPDVVRDEVYGYLSESSVESYVSAIYKFLSREIDKKILQQYFRHNYSIASCADKYVNLYIKR